MRNLTRRKGIPPSAVPNSVEREQSLGPLDRYQMRRRTIATVQRNSYVTLNKKHLHGIAGTICAGKRVEMVCHDTDTIDIFHGFTHVATHHRNDTPYEYTTKAKYNLP